MSTVIREADLANPERVDRHDLRTPISNQFGECNIEIPSHREYMLRLDANLITAENLRRDIARFSDMFENRARYAHQDGWTANSQPENSSDTHTYQFFVDGSVKTYLDWINFYFPQASTEEFLSLFYLVDHFYKTFAHSRDQLHLEFDPADMLALSNCVYPSEAANRLKEVSQRHSHMGKRVPYITYLFAPNIPGVTMRVISTEVTEPEPLLLNYFTKGSSSEITSLEDLLKKLGLTMGNKLPIVHEFTRLTSPRSKSGGDQLNTIRISRRVVNTAAKLALNSEDPRITIMETSPGIAKVLKMDNSPHYRLDFGQRVYVLLEHEPQNNTASAIAAD